MDNLEYAIDILKKHEAEAVNDKEATGRCLEAIEILEERVEFKKNFPRD
jgi:hypothetical protein